MTVKKAFFSFLHFIKNVYLMLFNFMIGDAIRKRDRIFVHVNTIMCLLLFPPVYINALVQLFTSEYSIVQMFFYMTLALIFLTSYPLAVKFVMYLSARQR